MEIKRKGGLGEPDDKINYFGKNLTFHRKRRTIDVKKTKIFLFIILYIIFSGQAGNIIQMNPSYDFPQPVRYAFYERDSWDGGKTYFAERKCLIEMHTKAIDTEKYLSTQYKTWDYKINGQAREMMPLSQKLTTKKLLMEKSVLWKLSTNGQALEIVNYDQLIEDLNKLCDAVRNSDIPESEKPWLRNDIIENGYVMELTKLESLLFNSALFNRKFKIGKNENFELDSKFMATDVKVVATQNQRRLSYRVRTDKAMVDFEIIMDTNSRKILSTKSTVKTLKNNNNINRQMSITPEGDRVHQSEIIRE